MNGDRQGPRWQRDDSDPLFGEQPDMSPPEGSQDSSKSRAFDLIIEVAGFNYCEGNIVKNMFQHSCTGDVNYLREAQYYIGALIDAHTCMQPDLPPERFPDTGLR